MTLHALNPLNRFLQKLLLCVFTLLFISTNALADNKPRRIIYQGDAVKITLGVGIEQRITFPDAKLVWADIKDKIKDKLTTQIVNKDIYWTAKDAFKEVRITVGEEGSNRIYLLDVSAAHKKVSNKRILLIEGNDPYALSDANRKSEPETVIAPLKKKQTPVAGFATLFKCAARQVYAPDRLRKCPVGIHKEFVNKRPIKHLIRASRATTKPMVAWRSGGLHITAIEVQNKLGQSINLDPRNLRGRWKAALFQHNRLTAQGTNRDTTTLYLISNQPFDDAIRANPIIQTGRR